MNLLWAFALSAYVVLERLVRLGHRLDRAVGIALLAWGLLLVAGHWVG